MLNWGDECHDEFRNTPFGKLFFRSIAKPETVRSIPTKKVRSILSQAFDNTVVMSLRNTCLQFSATMIAQVTDELVEAILRSGLERGAVDVVLEFIGYSGRPLAEDLLPQVKDEKPEMVSPLIESLVLRYSKSSTALAPGI
ncbi:unnamed protein product [Brassica rapa]|uniref:Uncharacterized protein n=1 Tax=Brassica campestris TaxID=3711 RepID=A0A8D9HTY0_BRACM|nr:unnamed protein product [Brassica rapa]